MKKMEIEELLNLLRKERDSMEEAMCPELLMMEKQNQIDDWENTLAHLNGGEK